MKSRKSKKSISANITTLVVVALFLITVTAAIFYFSSTDPRKTINEVGQQIGLDTAIDTDPPLSPQSSSLNSIGTPKTTSDLTSLSENNIAFDEGDFTRVLPKNGELSVIVLDVGKGDSIFIRTPNGKNMLIDTGTPDYWERLQFYFEQMGVTKLDAVVATHPHNDHIGSMSKILKNYNVDTIYMPRVSHTSNAYKKLLETIANQNKKVIALEGGKNQTIALDPAVTIDVFAPLSNEYEKLNDHSGVLRVQYGDNSMLLTGDAEKTSEADMVSYYGDKLQSDVLKVGHHGSKTSSKKDFLNTVAPKDAIISTAMGNEYKHPHQEVLDRLEKRDINIYRTDLNSSVGVFFNGTSYEIITARP